MNIDIIKELGNEPKPSEVADEQNILSKSDMKRLVTERIKNISQDRSLRKIFAYVLFGFLAVYAVATVSLVYICGFGVAHLSDAVLITMLSTTLANVIGTFSFVAKYLYKQ